MDVLIHFKVDVEELARSLARDLDKHTLSLLIQILQAKLKHEYHPVCSRCGYVLTLNGNDGECPRCGNLKAGKP